MHNRMEVRFLSRAQNEAFARVSIAAFAVQLNPTLPEMADIKTAVSEAVTNAIVHGYGGRAGVVRLAAGYSAEGELQIDVIDHGCGIEDVERARQPFFTTSANEERSGMGFTVMESFMDGVEVRSAVGRGTSVRLTKRIGPRDEALPRRA